MSDIGSHLLTLAAVVLGGVLSIVGGTLSERKRWLRERSSRWDQRRQSAYADYGRAMKKEIHIAMRIAGGLNVGPQSDPLELSAGRLLHQAAQDDRSALFEDVLLLGDNPTISAARVWQQAGHDTYQYVTRDKRTTEDEFRRLYARAGEARDKFYASARLSLDIADTTSVSAMPADTEGYGRY